MYSDVYTLEYARVFWNVHKESENTRIVTTRRERGTRCNTRVKIDLENIAVKVATEILQSRITQNYDLSCCIFVEKCGAQEERYLVKLAKFLAKYEAGDSG